MPRQKPYEVKSKTLFHGLAVGACACALAAAGTSGTPAVAATPPPTPPPMTGTPATPSATVPATATPAPLPSGFSMPGSYATPRPGASGSPSPPPEARKGIEGVWEVEIQRNDKTDYTHFKLTQNGSAITGTYVDTRGKKYPLAGTVDGQQIRLIVSMPDGTSLLMEGRLDGTTDMVGELTTPTEQVAFTASYRPKEKWIENVNPAPGGLGQPGGGGYTPP